MSNTTIEIVAGAEAADPHAIQQAYVDLAARLNPLPEHHIAFFGTTRQDIENVLQEAAPQDGSGILLATSGGRPVGGLALDYHTQIGRTWLLGPFADGEQWGALASALYDAAQRFIPAQAPQHELFCDVRHRNCISWAEQRAFVLDRETGIDVFARSSLAALPRLDPAVTHLSEQNVAVFDTLHAQLFPRTYANGAQRRAREPEHSAIFTVEEGDELLGYVAGKVMLDTQEGYIDYVGTADRARRQGIARRIVATTLHWMFSFPEVQLVNLTVDADNVAADALYRSLGFERERITRVYRRQVAPSNA